METLAKSWLSENISLFSQDTCLLYLLQVIGLERNKAIKLIREELKNRKAKTKDSAIPQAFNGIPEPNNGSF